MDETKTFPASLNHLYEMMHFILKKSREFGFCEENSYKIQLACEEAFVNIVKYGYLEQKGDITIAVDSLKNGLKITIKDTGVPFNPLEYPREIKFDTPIEQKQIGGLGIYLILKVMDELRYVREGEENQLTMVKYCRDKIKGP